MILHGTEPLSTLPIVVFDCQATGASPAKGHVIDLAWARISAATKNPTIEQTLVALPSGEDLPKRVSRITGVYRKDLVGAPPRFEAALQLTRSLDTWGNALAVAHWARYERAFVDDLLATELDWLCTHDLARRLVPGLPRKGLRAVAGYFGRPLDETKRASEHVEATAFIWRELVGLLAEEEVETVEELWRWLERPVRKTEKRTYALPRETRLALPDEPGVYRMLGRDGRILYVGKATSLKDRVNSYFRQRRLAERKMELVSQVWDLDVTTTASALEAAMLETDEIKRHTPPYNRQLRQDGRCIVWANPHDLSDTRSSPDSRHTLGPFSSPAMCAHYAELLAFLRGSAPMPWVSDAEQEVALTSREMFLRKYDLRDITPEAMIELGESLHPLPDTTDEEENGPAIEMTTVTADVVVEFIERGVVGLYRAVARGAWLDRLSTSSVRWEPAGQAGEWRQLELNDGAIGPEPGETDRWTVEAYDRVSVLLKELRRIVRDGRNVALRDRDGGELHREELTDELARF